MTDSAQLRKALATWDGKEEWNDPRTAPWVDLDVFVAAARERLAQLEAGALVIVPGEDGEWPEEVISLMSSAWLLSKHQNLGGQILDGLDALRDAMPGGEG